MDFTIISSSAGAHQTTGYSHAAQMGDLLFISEQVALNEAGELVGKVTRSLRRSRSTETCKPYWKHPAQASNWLAS